MLSIPQAKYNSVSLNKGQNKNIKQPTFNAVLRIYDTSNIILKEQKDFLFKKAQGVNCDWIYTWIEGNDIPLEVQITKGETKSHVELLEDLMPSVKGKETSSLTPFDALNGWLDILSKKYK
ncbi:MAG: hypothetical protein WCY19_00080 [Candidatus Gastranaerophilaceae bacterium]